MAVKPHVGRLHQEHSDNDHKTDCSLTRSINNPRHPQHPWVLASTGEVSIRLNPTVQWPGEGRNQTENVVFLHSNTRAPAEEMLQWDVGRQPSGKILSLDRRKAQKVLEIYVKRSLSCHENSLVAKKPLQERNRGRGRKTDGLQRSESDFCMYSCAKPSPRKDQEERLKAPDLEEALDDDSKASQEVPKEGLKAKRKSTKNSSQGKIQRSSLKRTWLKGFLNLFLKKSPEDQKENTGQKAKEKDVKAPQGSKPEGAKKHRVDSNTSPTAGRAQKKKPSLKKVFSLKKHGEEERGEPGSGARSKRPSCLPLRHVLAPAQPGGTPNPTLTHPCCQGTLLGFSGESHGVWCWFLTPSQGFLGPGIGLETPIPTCSPRALSTITPSQLSAVITQARAFLLWQPRVTVV